MTARKTGTYEVEHLETVAGTGDLRVRLYTLAVGQEVPWHYHSHITDTFFCLEGTLSVETRTPPGASCAERRRELRGAPEHGTPGHRPR